MRAEFDGSRYKETLTEVQQVETNMSTVPYMHMVNRTPNNQLSRMRVIAEPCTQENENISLLSELQNEIKFLVRNSRIHSSKNEWVNRKT